MIVPQYEMHTSRLHWPLTEKQKLEHQVEFGKARIGPNAAREIARRIEEEHGFWDHPRWAEAS